MSVELELKDAYEKLEKAENSLKHQAKELNRQYKVNQILIAAGFLTQEKINEAADILQDMD